jgi:hypothetical protein
MVTPWFAVATGFVVAAGLWIYSPHAELNIPNGAVGKVPCKIAGCGIASPNTNRNPAGGSLLPMTGSVGRLRSGSAAPPPLKFGYRVMPQSQGRFSLLITVSGTDVPHSWRLAFELPGDEVTFVQGASWQPVGRYSGVISWPASDNSWQSVGQGGDQGDHHFGRLSDRHGVSFLVSGIGAPVTPESCAFDGTSCQFSPLS